MDTLIENYFTRSTHYNFSEHNKIISFKLDSRGYVTFYRHLDRWHKEHTMFPHFSEYLPINSLNTADRVARFCQDCQVKPHINRYVPIVT